MPNPSVINTANVTQFGFSVGVMLEEKTIRFDTSGFTVYKTGGAALVQGINFEVVDPSGLTLSYIDFPSADIAPSTQSSYGLVLQSGFSLFGTYKIRGVLKEQDGKEYEVIIPDFDVCEPDGFCNGYVKGRFEVDTDCGAPRLDIRDITNTAYLGKAPDVKTNTGVLYFPQGTLASIPFTQVPLSISGPGNIYTGSYTVRNKLVASYAMGNNVYVYIAYHTSMDFDVTCESSIIKMLCCVEGIYTTYRTASYSISQAAKDKLDSISLPLMIAVLKEKCGEDAGDEIRLIEKTLGCDCGCGTGTMAPVPLNGSGSPSGSNIAVVGTCATAATPSVSAGVTTYTIKTKNVSISKANSADTAFSISRAETDCGINYSISFDYSLLATTLLTTIKNSTDLTNLFKTIYSGSSTAVDLSGLNGQSIIDLSSCSYSLAETVGGRVVSLVSVLIDGVTYNAPSGLLLAGDTDIENWLNTLSKGVFSAFYDTGTDTTTITSNNNSYVVSSAVFSQQGNGIYVKQFSRNCKSLKQILQAIINYLTTFTAKNATVGGSLSLCRLKPDGTKEIISFGTQAVLFDYLTAQAQAQCTLVDILLSTAGLTCTSVKNLFVQSPKTITATDYLLGTKGDDCARVSYDEIAGTVLNKIFSNSDLKTYLCRQVQACSAPVCTPVDNVTITVSTGGGCVSVSGITGTISAN